MWLASPRLTQGPHDSGDGERPRYDRRCAHDGRAPRGIPLVLRVEGPSEVPVLPADPTARGSLDALHLGRDAAAQALLLGREAASGAAVHHRAEVPSSGWQGHRPRRGRDDRAPRVDVRDARELLVRRLLQGRSGRLRLGVRDRAPGVRARPAVGDGLRRRPGPRARGGRGRGRRLAAQGGPARADRPLPALRQLLGARRRDRPVRAVLRAALRPRRRARLRRARLRPELRALRPLHRVLEPRLHGVRPRPRTGR